MAWITCGLGKAYALLIEVGLSKFWRRCDVENADRTSDWIFFQLSC